MESNFRAWTLDRIEENFGLVQVVSLAPLESLLSFDYTATDYQAHYLNQIAQNYLLFGGDDWNEVELENKIISPIIVLSEIDNKQFAYFLERELRITIGNYELSGKVDGMIATGFRRPKQPYFCLNEYKRGTDPNGDPRGQALIAMFVAQQLNANNDPIFGCYIIGRSWYFMALVGKEYAISNVYTCTDDGIFDIFRILKGLRWHIERLIA
ncbi:MAG: hypothetical protein EAZ91_09160 [Cytophagales bacterium]|nr:MAG: hypothetical protein EAZ91_09160 [Cytophagales bacterium]